jgi:hypothetical protein
MKKETPYMQKQHRTVFNRTRDSSNNEQNNNTFGADQTPHLHTNSHCLTHTYKTHKIKPQKHSHSNNSH